MTNLMKKFDQDKEQPFPLSNVNIKDNKTGLAVDSGIVEIYLNKDNHIICAPIRGRVNPLSKRQA